MSGDLMNPKLFLARLRDDDRGATAVEYGLIAALIVITMLGALKGVAQQNSDMWNKIRTSQDDAISGSAA
jgi:pilus assembly protein Flp/PilA